MLVEHVEQHATTRKSEKRRHPAANTLAVLTLLCACTLSACSKSGPNRLAPASDYTPTPEHEAMLSQFSRNVLTFTLLHEMGHMMVSQYHVPEYGRPEDLADRFAAAVMLDSSMLGGNGTVAVYQSGMFWDALFRRDGPLGINWTDEHSQPEERAYQLFCLINASDPSWRPRLPLNDEQLAHCGNLAAGNSNAWSDLVRSKLDPQAGEVGDPNAPNVAVFYAAPPDTPRRGLDPNVAMTLALESLPKETRAILTAGEARAREAGVLDLIASVFLQLKTPPASVTVAAPAGARDNYSLAGMSPDETKKIWEMIDRGTVSPEHLAPPTAVAPHIEHPISSNFYRASYNYLVLGDNCFEGKGEPDTNAFWSPKGRSITLCYSFVNMVDDIGRSLIVEADRAKH